MDRARNQFALCQSDSALLKLEVCDIGLRGTCTIPSCKVSLDMYGKQLSVVIMFAAAHYFEYRLLELTLSDAF